MKSEREKQGVVCKRYGGINHYWISTRDQHQCKDCKFRTTFTQWHIVAWDTTTFAITDEANNYNDIKENKGNYQAVIIKDKRKTAEILP